MKKIITGLLLIFITPLLFSQNEVTEKEIIPDNLLGSWVIEQPGEGQVPSQIFRWKFNKKTQKQGECEFYWMFKRQEDKEYITVAVAVYDFHVVASKIYGKMTKAGSQQKQAMVMEFYDEVKWYNPGDEFYDKFGMKEINTEFVIKNNLLNLLEDNNGDGDYDDEGESQSYAKEIDES